PDRRIRTEYSDESRCTSPRPRDERPRGNDPRKKFDEFPPPHGFTRRQARSSYEWAITFWAEKLCPWSHQAGLRHVRLTPKSGYCGAASRCPLSAIFGIMRGKKTVWRNARSGRRAADQPHRTAQAHAHTVRIVRQRLAERGDGGRDDLCRLVAQPTVHGTDFG